MNINFFYSLLENTKSDDEVTDICRKYLLHGTPSVFNGNDDDFYEFRRIIGNKFKTSFHEIYITGSAKLGFSPYKGTDFNENSDIDVSIISSALFESIMSDVSIYQMEYRGNRKAVTEVELKMYHDFLEYTALGWIRPDKLPYSFQIGKLRDDWFAFFRSISYGKSRIGNYKISAGVFKSYNHLEQYLYSGLYEVRKSLNRKKKWQHK